MFIIPLTIEDIDHGSSTLARWTRSALSVVVGSQIRDCKSWSVSKDFESLPPGSRLGEISFLTIGASRSIYSGLSGSDEVECRFRSTVRQPPKANLACACCCIQAFGYTTSTGAHINDPRSMKGL